jgi:hypothetical protein
MKCRWLILAALALAAGCSTPESRIKKNPELFAQFPPDVQENVRQGKIDIGYDREMVEMALDKPNRKYFRKTTAGETEVWAYSGYEMHTERQHVQADVRVRDADGGSRTVRDWFWVDVQQRTEYDRIRVDFGPDGKVVGIETVER